jgi:hypothetical protein
MRGYPATVLILTMALGIAAPALAKPLPAVGVEAELSAAGARLTLMFYVPAQHVSVQVRGADGLLLVGPVRSQHDRTYAAGERSLMTVGFAQTAPKGTLVVRLQGEFNGVPQALVRSFAVGPAAPAQQHKMGRPGRDRRPLHLLPATDQRHQ